MLVPAAQSLHVALKLPLRAAHAAHRDTLCGGSDLAGADHPGAGGRYFLLLRRCRRNSLEPPQTVHIPELPRPTSIITCAPHSAHSQRTPAVPRRGMSSRDQVGAAADMGEVKIWNMGVSVLPFAICVE